MTASNRAIRRIQCMLSTTALLFSTGSFFCSARRICDTKRHSSLSSSGNAHGSLMRSRRAYVRSELFLLDSSPELKPHLT